MILLKLGLDFGKVDQGAHYEGTKSKYDCGTEADCA